MSCSPGASSGDPRRSRARGRCAATAATPSSRDVVDVVDDEHEAVPHARRRTSRNQSLEPADRESAPRGARPRPRRARRVGVGRDEHLDEARRRQRDRRAPRASARRRTPRCRTAGCRAARSASTTRRGLERRGARRARRTPGRRRTRAPAASSCARRTNGPSASSAGSSGSRVALLGAQRGRPFDEHVAQRGETAGRGAQHLAREPAVARAGFDDEERIGLARARPSSRSSAAPTHAPNSGPTSGLVTKSRPGAAGAAPAREEAALVRRARPP